ncbi:MAG: hypothetical protein WAM13_17645 [Candidatus Sulfotelmatobacter sp.]|jgi:hypothetical protein
MGARPLLFTAIGVFLFFGTVMASLAAITLIWRGTVLDRIWTLNPRGLQQLAPFGKLVGISFLVLAAVLALAGVGWFRLQLWGWRLCVAIIATQVLGDLVNCLRGDFLRGGVGFAIAGALLIYVLRSKIRAYFRETQRQHPDITPRIRLP